MPDSDLDKWRQIANDPMATDEQRALAVARLVHSTVAGAQAGAAKGAGRALEDVTKRSLRAATGAPQPIGAGADPTAWSDIVAGAQPGIPLISPLVRAGAVTREIMGAPAEVALGAAQGAVGAAPGPDPQPWEPPPPVQPTPPPPAVPTAPPGPRAPATAPTTATPQVAPIRSGVGRVRGAGEAIQQAGAETRAGIRSAVERQREALGRVGAARQAEAEIRAGGFESQADVVQGRIDYMKAREQEQRDALNRYVTERDQIRKTRQDALAAKKYHRLSETEAAGLVSRRRDLEESISTSPQGQDVSREAAELAAIDQKLEKASKVSGEWDFDNPAEVFAAIAQTVGVALGSFGSALTGGPNHALQIANETHRRRVQQQKDQIAKRGAVAEGFVNELDELRRSFGDDQLAENTMHQRVLDQYQAALDHIVLTTESQAVKQAIEGIGADFAKQKADLEANARLREGDVAMKTAQAQQRTAIAEAQLQQRADIAQQHAAIQQMNLILRQQTSKAALAERQLPGLRIKEGVRPSEKSFEKAQEFIHKYRNANMQLQKLIEKRGDVFAYLPQIFSSSRAEAEAIRADLINVMKDMEGMGANFTVMEKSLLEMKIGESPAELGPLAAKLREVMATEYAKAINRLGAYGYEFDQGDPFGDYITERPPL